MYAKLFASLYQGTMRGQSDMLLVFTALLAHADKEGHVDIHPRAIAEAVGLDVARVRAALDALEAPDEESRSAEEEGRRLIRIDEHRAWGWVIVNYCKYRAIRSEEDRREQNRRAQEKWREKAKEATSKPSSADVSRDKPQSAHTEVEAEAYTEAEQKKRGARVRAAPVGRPPSVSERVWQDWLSLRKAKRAPVTQTVVDSAEAEAVKAGMPFEEFLRIWCARGSQGLQAEWLKPEEMRSVRAVDPPEPQWRKEQRERNEAFLGPYSARAVKERMQSETINIEGEENAVPRALR